LFFRKRAGKKIDRAAKGKVMADIDSTRARILMVDDHPDTNAAMQRLLTRLGYDVRTADCVQSALRVANDQPFDILISDVGLPDGSGMDLMRQLLANHSQPSLKGIAISGFNRDEDIQSSLEAGFSEHLAKPVNLQRLQILIEKLIA
jgi:CheY-like chemotaxis protein